MADNYLENKYEAYLQRKEAAEKAKRSAWKKRMAAYRKKLAKEAGLKENDVIMDDKKVKADKMSGTTDYNAALEMMRNVKVVVFDADDTLWDNQSYYDKAERDYCAILSDYGDSVFVSAELQKTETSNMGILGYGVKAFTISMMETALRISGDSLRAVVQKKIIEIGKNVLALPATPLDGVTDTLDKFVGSGKYRLALMTKGDPLDQKNKLSRSGLAGYFEHISIVADKTEDEYHKLCGNLGIFPQDMVMVGNSFKSDISPVIKIGGYGIYIPFHTTWWHESTEEYEHDRLLKLNCFKELDCLL